MNLGIMVVAILLCLLAVEGVLRVTNPHFPFHAECSGSFIEPDPLLGWKCKPNSFETETYYKGSGHIPGETITIKINSKGLRDDEYSYSKPENTTRILLIGDSFTFGSEVNQEDNISENMERMLKDYQCQVLNFGVVAYGTIQEYLLLREEGMKYSPDVVLTLFFGPNDGIDNIGVSFAEQPRPLVQHGRIIPAEHTTKGGDAASSVNPFESLGYYLMGRSSVFALLGQAYYVRVGRLSAAVDYERQVKDTIFALRKIDELCHVRNIGHEVVIIPGGILVSDKYKATQSLREYNEKFATDIIAGLKSCNIPYIDLIPLLRNESRTEDLYFCKGDYTDHLTPKGNIIVARILAEEVKKRYLGGD